MIDTTPCPKCDQQHLTKRGTPACTGHVDPPDGTLRPCGNSPRRGGTVCGYHGGKAPQVVAAAVVRQQEAEAARQVATLGLPVDISPTDALLEEVQWTAGHVAWLRRRVQELGEMWDEEQTRREHPLVWGTTKTGEKHSTEKGYETTTTESAGPSIWYQLYAKEREHLVAVCAAALKAGVEERRVRLAEQQGDLVAEVIRRILDALNLTPEQQQLVPVVVPQQLRLIAGGAA